MSRVIGCLGAVLLLLGVWFGVSSYRFADAAVLVQAKVLEVRELKGPPKPRQKTPILVSFELPSRGEVRAETNLPFLQVIKEGDVIRVLVDPEDPQRVKLPLWSELWAVPLTYLVGGLLVLILSFTLRERRLR